MQPKLEFFKGSLGLQLCPRIGPVGTGKWRRMRFWLVTRSWITVVGIATKVLFTGVNCDRSVCLSILKLSYG